MTVRANNFVFFDGRFNYFIASLAVFGNRDYG
jgi:hypothetical protein